MKTYRSAWLPLITAGIGAIAGFLLRLFVLQNCMDERSLLIPGSLGLLWLVLFAAVIAAALTALVLRLPKVTKGADAAFDVRSADLPAVFAASALVLAGSVCSLTQGDGTGGYLCVGGAVSALLFAAMTVMRSRGKEVSFWLAVPLTICAAARLILDFKDWSTDPRVIDFCYRLFADGSTLLALHFLSGFSLKVGRSRAAVLWCLLAYVFAVSSVPDFLLDWGFSAGACLTVLGLGMACMLYAMQLLRGPFEEPEQPPEEAEAEQSPEGEARELPAPEPERLPEPAQEPESVDFPQFTD